MNTLETLKNIRDYIKNTDHWLADSFATPSALSVISERIQIYAQQLKELEEASIKDLQDNGPKVSGDIGDITITLLRDGKQKHAHFGEYTVDVILTNDEAVRTHFKLDGPPDVDGNTYFVRASPGDYGQVAFGIWLSKDEAIKLKKNIRELEDDYWHQEIKCTFCGEMESVCGGDHGDEMREIQREYFGRD